MPQRVPSLGKDETTGGLDRIWARVLTKGAALEADRVLEEESSRALLPELMALPEQRRDEAVAADPRLWTLAMVDRLLRLAERSSAATARSHAELALAVVQRLEAGRYGASILAGREAVAWCSWADARRRQGDLEAAESGFRDASRQLDAELLDSWERAAYCRRLAALRQEQERADEALGLLLRAAELYRLWGEFLLEAESLCDAADLWLAAADPETALQLFETAQQSADPPTAAHPTVSIRVLHGLAKCHAHLGEARSADQALRAAQPLYGLVADPTERLRLLSTEARIVAEYGTPGRAIALLNSVLRKMIERGASYDAALATLDLAQLEAERGQIAEVRRLADQTAPLVASQDLPEPAASVLHFALRFASKRRPGAIEILEEAGSYLDQARENPTRPIPWEERAWTELPWDGLPLDLRRSLCLESGLPADLAPLPTAAISPRDQRMLAWTYLALARIRLRFDPIASAR